MSNIAKPVEEIGLGNKDVVSLAGGSIFYVLRGREDGCVGEPIGNPCDGCCAITEKVLYGERGFIFDHCMKGSFSLLD